jgi:hypothetical protein
MEMDVELNTLTLNIVNASANFTQKEINFQ